MRRMAAASVLIVGLKGLGAEIAKNIILAGVKSVTLSDSHDVELRDLGAQFYLSETDVGSNRAEACRDRLQELNTAVAVSTLHAELSASQLSKFDVVVVTDAPLKEAIRINEECRQHGVAFVKAEIRGVFANVFSDFGPAFTVLDVDGEEPFMGIVAGITPGPTTLVTCVEDERLEFQDGQLVTFTEIKGMTDLSDGRPRRIRNCKAHSFEVMEDSTAYSPYVSGGIATQVKESIVLSFRSLAESLEDPAEFLLTDFAKLERSPLLHIGFQALDAFTADKGRLPGPGSEADAELLLEKAKQLNASAKTSADIDEDVLKLLAFGASGDLNPMAAMFGGIVGQEIVKAASGKFHPLYQWLYFDSVESLPAIEHLTPEECAQQGTRYDSQIAVFGKSVQSRLQDVKLFLVGAGALGCEFIKNFACMGIATGASGLVTLTDDDIIEKSNLSRQFLFRDWDIGSYKSTVAATAANAINPDMNIRALQNRVSPETEDVFNDSFWEELDGVVNALDNVNARLYVDGRCVYFQKPLLESGTLGTKCNTQMVIPNLTENYGASRDPPEKQAPMCTLHSFPHNIDHCLTTARSDFEGLLDKAPAEVNSFLADPVKYIAAVRANSDAAARESLENVVDLLVTNSCQSFADCVAWARKLFESQFHDRIAQLVYTFPEDAVTSTGSLFWSPPKRCPHPLDFSASDAGHATFVQAGAILKAAVHGIALPAWAVSPSKVASVAAAVQVPQFKPQKGVQIETDPKATKAVTIAQDDESVIEALITKLEAARLVTPAGFKLNPVQFEKDDDTNFHMDFIAGLANMRARNYNIEEVDKLKAKLIAGKIIPAIATATAMATGLICLDLYKTLQGKPIEAYRNTFANLALPLFAMAEPIPPKTVEFNGMKWTLWERWILEGDLTVQQVIDWFADRKLTAYSISGGPSLLYNNFFPSTRSALTRNSASSCRQLQSRFLERTASILMW